jgi:hypothetical protein
MKKSNRKRCNGKGFIANDTQVKRIEASTLFETCTEQLSPFGGLTNEFIASIGKGPA